MNTKKLIMAVVTATTLLIGGLGVALWPSPAEALGAVRKFSGLLFTDSIGQVQVAVHNPHPTATYKATVVVRSEGGGASFTQDLLVGPHKAVKSFSPPCIFTCTVEVTMANAILQPSAKVIGMSGTQHVYSGDFSR